MSVGDLKTYGQKGSNWNWQYRVLLGLEQIANTLIQNDNEFEAQIVVQTCPGSPPTQTYLLEVRIFDPTSGSFSTPTYYLPNSNTPFTLTPGCTLTYANDSALLAQILIQLQQINNGIPNTLGQQTMANSMPVVIASDQSGILRYTGYIRPINTSGNLNTLVSIFYSVSVANVGTNDGTVLGNLIRPGEVLNFSADGLNNYFNSFDYDATNTEFIITYVY